MVKLENDRHIEMESEVAKRFAEKMKCTFRRMGPYSPFDVYLIRGDDIVGFAEIRTRGNRASKDFSTVFLDIDKWHCLFDWEVCLHKASYYVVAFTDGIFFIRVGELPVMDFRMTCRGRTDRPESPNDKSAVIEVPTERFKLVCRSDGLFEEPVNGKRS